MKEKPRFSKVAGDQKQLRRRVRQYWCQFTRHLPSFWPSHFLKYFLRQSKCGLGSEFLRLMIALGWWVWLFDFLSFPRLIFLAWREENKRWAKFLEENMLSNCFVGIKCFASRSSSSRTNDNFHCFFRQKNFFTVILSEESKWVEGRGHLSWTVGQLLPTNSSASGGTTFRQTWSPHFNTFGTRRALPTSRSLAKARLPRLTRWFSPRVRLTSRSCLRYVLGHS